MVNEEEVYACSGEACTGRVEVQEQGNGNRSTCGYRGVAGGGCVSAGEWQNVDVWEQGSGRRWKGGNGNKKENAPVSVQDGSRTRAQDVADAGCNSRTDKGELPGLYVVPHAVRAAPYCRCRLCIHERLQTSTPNIWSLGLAAGGGGGATHEGGICWEWRCEGA